MIPRSRRLALLSLGVLMSGTACDQKREGTLPPGPTGSEAGAPATGLRLVPDWEAVTAVVVGVSQAFGSETFTSASGEGARSLLDERLGFYRSIVEASPDVRLILFVDRAQDTAAARAAIRDTGNHLSVVVQPSCVWMRDFAPLTATLNGGGRALVSYTSYMDEVSRTIADQVALPLLRGAGQIAPHIEGGNILVDGEGRCYVAAYSSDGELERESALEVRDLRNICTEVRTVPKMSHEKTGHIDIFARLLNDTTAVVAEYANEDFHLAAEPVERELRCTDEQIRSERWEECEAVLSVYPDMGRLHRESPGSSTDLPVAAQGPEVMALLSDLYPGEEPEVEVRRYTLSRHEHLERVAEAFRGYGFHVVRVENPTPYISLERIAYEDGQGRVLRKILRVQAIFPTYTNSLLVNGVVYLPEYETASDAQNARAIELHEQAGFTVVPTPMTQSISFHGATRCLSQEIHGS